MSSQASIRDFWWHFTLPVLRPWKQSFTNVCTARKWWQRWGRLCSEGCFSLVEKHNQILELNIWLQLYIPSENSQICSIYVYWKWSHKYAPKIDFFFLNLKPLLKFLYQNRKRCCTSFYQFTSFFHSLFYGQKQVKLPEDSNRGPTSATGSFSQ